MRKGCIWRREHTLPQWIKFGANAINFQKIRRDFNFNWCILHCIHWVYLGWVCEMYAYIHLVVYLVTQTCIYLKVYHISMHVYKIHTGILYGLFTAFIFMEHDGVMNEIEMKNCNWNSLFFLFVLFFKTQSITRYFDLRGPKKESQHFNCHLHWVNVKQWQLTPNTQWHNRFFSHTQCSVVLPFVCSQCFFSLSFSLARSLAFVIDNSTH